MSTTEARQNATARVVDGVMVAGRPHRLEIDGDRLVIVFGEHDYTLTAVDGRLVLTRRDRGPACREGTLEVRDGMVVWPEDWPLRADGWRLREWESEGASG